MRAWLSFSFDLRRLSPRLLLRLGAAEAALRTLAAPLAPAWRAEREDAAMARLLAAVLGPAALPAALLQDRLDGGTGGAPGRLDGAIQALRTALAQPAGAVLDAAAIQHYHRLSLGVPAMDASSSFTLMTQFGGHPGQEAGYRAILIQLGVWLGGPDFDAGGRALGGVLAGAAALLHLQALQLFRSGNDVVAAAVAIHCLRRAALPGAAALAAAEALPQAGRAGDLPAAVDAVTQYLEAEAAAWQAQLDRLAREDHLTALFGSRNDPGAERRRLLAGVLLDRSATVPLRRLRHCTPEVAAAYAGLSGRTLLRDLDALEAMGLVRRARGQVQAASWPA